jgi:glycosyltransferase involved in cell wall biosynthesis
LLGRDWRLLKRYEGELCRRFDAVLTVTQEDLDALREAAGAPFDAHVIPIAIDTRALQLVERAPNPRTVLHIGTMYWPPNVMGVMWFAREVWPHVKAAVPDARFEIVGARPPQEVQALRQSDPAVHVAGYVADPTEIFQRTAVAIVPVSAGSGMRVKILEAFARGLPTVSTTIGFEGIAVANEHDLLVADASEDYARAVIRLLQDPSLGQRLSANARQLVEKQYDYRAACKPLDAVYTRLSAAGKTDPPKTTQASRNDLAYERENALTQSLPKSGVGD